MTDSVHFDAQNSGAISRWQRWAPALTLIVVAPGIAEVSSGATRLSFIFVFFSEMMVWGCGALIIRELVRRWQAGWTSMFLLGLCLSIAEEFLIQQTSLAPLPWVPAPAYGRVWGVNLIYFLFMLGFESVLVVLVPVQLTELIFPARRREPWLKKSGVVTTSIVFAVGSFIAWFLWIKIARAKVLHVPPYNPPLLTLLAGVLMIAALSVGAYMLRNVDRPSTAPPSSAEAVSPWPWIVGIATLLFGFPWYALMGLVFVPGHHVPLWIPVLAAIVWAILAYVIARWFSRSSGWSDIHRWSAVFCASLVCMIAGFLGSSAWSRIDLVGKIILNFVSVAGFIWLGLKITRRSNQASANLKP
jgi:hypothetical protein